MTASEQPRPGWPAGLWADHVSAALLGTQRRPVPRLQPALLDDGPAAGGGADEAVEQPGLEAVDAEGGGPGDPPGVLLEQAAVLAVGRRAGRPAGRGTDFTPIAVAPAETAPTVPPAAARRLAQILTGDQVRLLPEWLDAAAERGYRVPAPLLPELLERGRGQRALRPSIARAAGRRGVWLALRNTDWAYLVGEGADPGDDDPQVWQTGTRNQRVAYLTRLRERDPAAARDALMGTWASEPAPDRAALLATLEHGLAPADEEFLEEALADRAKDVRRLAADLLARLPGSAYGRRMAVRAHACLRPQVRTVRGRRQTWIVVAPPDAHDDDMARDGIPFHPAGSFAPDARSGSPIGVKAGWLREVLARTPLQTWTELFERPAVEVACLPVAQDGRSQASADDRSARDVHVGWVRAAVRQRDTEWARALLKAGVVVADEPEALADLLEVVPAAERDAVAAGLLRRLDDPADLLRLLDRVPGPWTGELADAVVGLLASAVLEEDGGGHPRRRILAPLCRLADARLTPDAAPRLDTLARRHPQSWPLIELTGTLRFRKEMLRELP